MFRSTYHPLVVLDITNPDAKIEIWVPPILGPLQGPGKEESCSMKGPHSAKAIQNLGT